MSIVRILRQESSLGMMTAGLGWDVAKGLGTDVDLVARRRPCEHSCLVFT